MPTYTYECPKHGEFDQVQRMADAELQYPCPRCERTSNRIFRVHQTIPDDLGRDLVCTTLMGVDGDKRKSPVVRSRSELERVIRRHNEIYGTSLEHSDKGIKARDWAED